MYEDLRSYYSRYAHVEKVIEVESLAKKERLGIRSEMKRRPNLKHAPGFYFVDVLDRVAVTGELFYDHVARFSSEVGQFFKLSH